MASPPRLQPPLFCWKWSWDSNPNNPCGKLISDSPFLFKSIHTLASIASQSLFKNRNKNPPSPPSLSQSQQGEAEQRALAAALAGRKEATVVEFYSPKCRLCNSLLPLVLDFEEKNSDWVSFVLADAENDLWLPELIHYDIKYVPCFVLLDKHGRALGKTGVPLTRQHVIAGLSHLLQLKCPVRNKGKISS